MKKITLTLFMLQTLCNISYAQSGFEDNTFGNNGRVITSFGGTQGDQGEAVAIQNDGKIIVAGTASVSTSTSYDFALVRYNTNGSLDNTFGAGGKVTTDFSSGSGDGATSISLQSDGKIVVAGGSNSDFALVRYNSNGSLDNTFGSGGKVTTDFAGNVDGVLSIAIQSDGKIVVSGVSDAGSNYDFALTRYNSNGSLDNTFGSGGKVTTAISSFHDWGYSVAIQSDGKIVVAGTMGTNSPSSEFALVRYNSNGSLDNTFGSGGIVLTTVLTDDYGLSVKIQSDGKIVVGGNTYNTTINHDDFALVRYNSNGSLDNTFGTGGKVTTSFGNNDNSGKSVAIQSDGKIVLAGASSNTYPVGDFALLRYNSNGSLDNTFGTGGIDTTNFGYVDQGSSVAIQSDGKIVVAGNVGQQYYGDFAIARYNNVVLSGIAELGNSNESEIKIYPNPSSGIFTLNLKDKTVETKVCIHDVLGNCVLDKVFAKSNDQEIDLSSQPKGIYFMEIISEDQRAVKKIVLE